MSSEWQITTFAEAPFVVIDGDRGANYPKQHEFSSYGYCLFLNAGNVSRSGFVFSDCAFITEEKDSILRKGKLARYDLVLTTRGTVGNVAYFSDEVPFSHIRINSGMVILRPDQSRIDPYYLYLFLRSKSFNEQVAFLTSGSAQPQLPIRDMNRVEMPLPPLEEQRKICSTLRAFDDQITLLRETNATLEAIAQALFKSWFVDFDPVRAKAEGRARQDGERSGQPRMPQASDLPRPGAEAGAEAQGQPEAMDATTAALFPDSFEESELGLVPKGWAVKPVGDAVDCLGGGTPDTKESSYWEPAEHCWTTPKDLSGLQSPVLLRTERQLSTLGLAKVSSGLLPAGTLLLSSRAPIGYLAIAQMPVAVNQGYIAIPPGGELSPVYMLFWCRQNMEGIKGRANGSTFMEISKKAFRPIPALVPTADVLDAFANIAEPLFERLIENERQAQTLTQLRDTLLPRLISGQLRLPEAEATVEEVL